MAVTVYDILSPEGELTKSMFPDADVDALATVWFADAAARTASLEAGEQEDAAIKAWAYYRAFTTIAGAIAVRPTTSDYYNVRQETWGADRIKYFQQRAEFYLDQFNLLAVPVVTYTTSNYSNVATRTAVW